MLSIYNIIYKMVLISILRYALPSKKLIIQNFKPLSSVTQTEYKLSIYQRNFQVCTFSTLPYCAV